MNDAPLGMFLTWTVYGTFLPGDGRGWRHRTTGPQESRPALEAWSQTHLSHETLLLDDSMRATLDRIMFMWLLALRITGQS
jgi:hypothetical protein